MDDSSSDLDSCVIVFARTGSLVMSNDAAVPLTRSLPLRELSTMDNWKSVCCVSNLAVIVF